jgi:hypothetical protein
MPGLIVVEKIDGSAVAWRCSDCRQGFSVRGKLTMQERLRQVTSDFKAHMEERHKTEARASGMARAAGVPLPD